MSRLIFILFIFSSCSQNKLDGFGDAKLGMSIQDFNSRFSKSYPENKLSFKEDFDTLIVDENLVLKNGGVTFDNSKLTKITTPYDKNLFLYLKKYGIKRSDDLGVVFNTDDSIFCTAGKKNNKFILIGIMDIKNNFD